MALNQYASDAFTITVKPTLTSTHTEAYWKELAGRNGAVKYTAAIPLGDTPRLVTPLANNNKVMAGVLIAVSGTGTNFRATLQLRSPRIGVTNTGSTATALADADYWAGVKGLANGYLQIERAAADAVVGVAVVGGNTVKDFAIAFDLTLPDITA